MSSSKLTAAQKAMIENKRLDALDRKRMKANQKLEKESLKSSIDKKRGGTSKRPATTSEIMLINDNAENIEEYGEKYIDTGAGFLLSANQKRYKPREAAPEEIMDTDLCDNCELPFENSYLRKHYNALVCDECKDDEKYPLMTLSEVKTEYVLNDNHLKRDPALKFILKKNPHNPSWGEMKLFLLPQVETRALEIHESWEKLEELKKERENKRIQRQQKQFDKKLQKLKQEVRAKNFKVAAKVQHEHEYSKVEHVRGDIYRKTCDCGLSVEYEEF